METEEFRNLVKKIHEHEELIAFLDDMITESTKAFETTPYKKDMIVPIANRSLDSLMAYAINNISNTNECALAMTLLIRGYTAGCYKAHEEYIRTKKASTYNTIV